jgi:hypothetical protein
LKKKKGDNLATLSLPAITNSSVALLPLALKSLSKPVEKKRDQIFCLAKF